METTNFLDFYKKLPATEFISPKSNFIKQVAKECGVTTNTVRNWVLSDMKPSNPAYVEVLSRIMEEFKKNEKH